jgi:hypothetical protein
MDDLRDGVYLNLPFDVYIKQKGRFGSTEKSALWLRREGWWWKYLSPFRKTDSQSPEQTFGEQLHAALLEGMHAYESRYIVEPDKGDYPDALFTVDQIKDALRRAGVHLGSTTSYKKEDWCDAAEIHLPDVVVWDNLRAEFDRRRAVRDTDGQITGYRKAVSAQDDFSIRAMVELATEDRPENAEMRELLSVGSVFPVISELSVLWTDDTGMKHRARFDKILPTVTVDLKSTGAWTGRPLVHSLDRTIKDLGYDVQRADYDMARRAMSAMIVANPSCIHGGTEEERLHLEAIAHFDQTHRPGWAWLFFSKPDAAGRAPVLFPLREEFRDPYHLAGFRKRALGLQLYRDCMARFGPDRPWGSVEPAHWTTEKPKVGGKAQPFISTSHWGFGPDDPVEGEAEYFAD